MANHVISHTFRGILYIPIGVDITFSRSHSRAVVSLNRRTGRSQMPRFYCVVMEHYFKQSDSGCLAGLLLGPPTVESSYTTAQRLPYIDTAKAICIFLMVVGHSSINNILSDYIYSFHMPAFFIISGILYKPHSALKTIKAFSVPVFVFSTINLFILFLIGEVHTTDISFSLLVREFLQYRHGMVLTLFKGVWFIWVLVAMRFLFCFLPILRKERTYYICASFFCVFYMTFVNYLIDIDTLFRGYYIGYMIPSLPFYCFGFFLKDNHWSPRDLSSKHIVMLLATAIIMPLINGHFDIYNNVWGYNYLLSAAIAIFSTIFLFWFSSKIPHSKFTESISKGTLVVLGTHWPILCILARILPSSLEFVYPFIVIIVCYYIIIFCDKFCPILLGKEKSNHIYDIQSIKDN